MARLAGVLGQVAGEGAFALGIVGMLWLAAFLFEAGYAARWGLPIAYVDIGLSQPLALALTVGLCAAALAASPLAALGRAYPFLLETGDRRARFAAAAALAALALLAFAVDSPRDIVLWLAGAGGGPPSIVALAIELCLAVQASKAAVRFAGLAAADRLPDLAAIGLTAAGLAVLPLALGWWDAAREARSRRAYLALAETPDYLLVRLYPDRALYVHWDEGRGGFDGAWRALPLDSQRHLVVRMVR